MLLGFISLLLTVGQGPISNICIPKSVGASWHPCSSKEETNYEEEESDDSEQSRRKLLSFLGSGGSLRRVLAAAGTDKCEEKVFTRPVKFYHLSFSTVSLFETNSICTSQTYVYSQYFDSTVYRFAKGN